MVVSNCDGTGDDGSLADFAWRDNGIVGRADGDDGISSTGRCSSDMPRFAKL